MQQFLPGTPEARDPDLGRADPEPDPPFEAKIDPDLDPTMRKKPDPTARKRPDPDKAREEQPGYGSGLRRTARIRIWP